MVLVPQRQSKTLKGHKLIILIPYQPIDYLIEDVKKQYPDLEIISNQRDWFSQESTGISSEDWQSATILMTGTTVPLPEEAKKLQLVQLVSAGANHMLDKPLFVDTDVAFCTANGVHGPQISEWIVATYLAHQHKFPGYLKHQGEARWSRIDSPVQDAVQQRVGILGYGSIGRQTARVCKAMGMSVHAYTLHPRDTPESRKDLSYHPPGLGDADGLLPDAWYSGSSTEDLHNFLGSDLDLLVVALPLTPKTTGLIGKAEFEVLGRKKTFVSNIARGPIINTDDLYDALENEVIRGAALDVTDPEPLPDGHKLWGAKNAIITPHVSGQSVSYKDRCFEILKVNLARLADGEEFMNKVNRKEGY